MGGGAEDVDEEQLAATKLANARQVQDKPRPRRWAQVAVETSSRVRRRGREKVMKECVFGEPVNDDPHIVTRAPGEVLIVPPTARCYNERCRPFGAPIHYDCMESLFVGFFEFGREHTPS